MTEDAIKYGRGQNPASRANLDPRPRVKGDRETVTVSIRLTPVTIEVLDANAVNFGCLYGGKPSLAKLLEMIGEGKLILATPSPISVPKKD